MPTIEILERTTCGGEIHPAGARVEATEADVRTLVAMGKARIVTDKLTRAGAPRRSTRATFSNEDTDS